MGLQEKLDAIREGAKDRIPAEAREVMHRATEDLKSSGILDRVAGVGETVPAFELPNVHGETVSSSRLLANGPLVLTIYRGVW